MDQAWPPSIDASCYGRQTSSSAVMLNVRVQQPVMLHTGLHTGNWRVARCARGKMHQVAQCVLLKHTAGCHCNLRKDELSQHEDT